MTTSALVEALQGVADWRQEREDFFDGKENEFSLTIRFKSRSYKVRSN